MSDLKRYGIIIITLLLCFLAKFNNSMDSIGTVNTFRGASLKEEAFYPLMAESFNEKSLVLYADDRTYTNDAMELYMDSNLHLMISTDILSEVFSCNSAVYNGNSLIVEKFDDEIIFTLGNQKVSFDDNARQIICPLTAYQGQYYVGIEDLASLLGYSYTWNGVSAEATLLNQRIGEKFIPESFDLREHGQAPEIRNQGSEATCWAYASTAALESLKLPEEDLDFSVESMVNYSAFNGAQLQGGGEYTKALAYLLSWNGPVLNDEAGAIAGHLQEVIIPTAGDIEEIKEDVFLYGGVQTSLFCTNLSDSPDARYYSSANNSYYYDGVKKPNHDIVVIGWDDNYPASNFKKTPEGDGAFICQNSWGQAFGDNGVFYVSYYDKNIATQSVVYTKLENSDNYDTIYQSDLCGWVGLVGFGREDAYFANVYEAQGDDWIEAAGFYATGPYTEYEVYMVTDYEGTEDLSKEGIKVASGHLEDAGYYTIRFDHHVEVAAGSKFAIGVYIKTPGSIHPVAVEYAADEITANCDISDGESYISENASEWDSVEETANANVCLKAYGSSW